MRSWPTIGYLITLESLAARSGGLLTRTKEGVGEIRRVPTAIARESKTNTARSIYTNMRVFCSIRQRRYRHKRRYHHGIQIGVCGTDNIAHIHP